AVGGIPELVAEECHAANLFEPRAEVLARRLRQALREGVAPARAAHDAGKVNAAWEDWHRQFQDDRRPASRTLVEEGSELKRLIHGQARCIEWLQGELRAYSGGGEK